MSCLCGLRLWGGKKVISSPPSVDRDDVEERPRPYSGSTAVGTSSTGDIASDDKEKESEKKVTPEERRSRPRSVSQRLAVPVEAVEAFTTALRDRARSRSRSKSLLPPPKPSEDDEKNVPSLPSSHEKAPQSSVDLEKAPRQSLGEEEKPYPSEVDSEKPTRLELDPATATGPAWPLRDDQGEDEKANRLTKASGVSKRTNSVDSLDTPTSPTSPGFADDEKKHLSMATTDTTRDSKLEDEGLDSKRESVQETPEQVRRRRMRESRQKLKVIQPKEEQDRLDMFQCM